MERADVSDIIIGVPLGLAIGLIVLAFAYFIDHLGDGDLK